MNFLKKAWKAYRTFRTKPCLRPHRGELLFIRRPEGGGCPDLLAQTIAPGERPLIVGTRRSHPVMPTVRLSLVAACDRGQTPLRERGSRLASVVYGLELNELLEKPVQALSLLEQLHVGLAIGLLWAPRVLLVDEPAGLGEADRTRMVALFRRLQLRTKVTTVWLSERPLCVESLSDRVIHMATQWDYASGEVRT